VPCPSNTAFLLPYTTQPLPQVLGLAFTILKRLSSNLLCLSLLLLRITASTKKRCQLLLGKYIELVTASPQLHSDDKDLLDMLCPRILKSDLDSVDDNEDEDGAEVPECQQKMFTAIMMYLYSGNPPRNARAAKLINRLETLGMLSRKGRELCSEGLTTKAPIFSEQLEKKSPASFNSTIRRRTVKVFDTIERLSPFTSTVALSQMRWILTEASFLKTAHEEETERKDTKGRHFHQPDASCYQEFCPNQPTRWISSCIHRCFHFKSLTTT